MFKASAAASSVGVGRYDDESPTSPTDKLLSPGPRPKLPCKVLLSAALSLYPWFVGFLDVQRLLGNIWYPTEELGSPVPVDSIIGTPSLVIDSSGKPQSFVGLEESYVNNEAKCLALGLRNLYTCPVLTRTKSRCASHIGAVLRRPPLEGKEGCSLADRFTSHPTSLAT
uniref:Uncharacterized protein LOC105137965 n=1 Tax=Rhizophora mucronata TaxID=61149 RepID=A0A2P2K6F8_RHIMU